MHASQAPDTEAMEHFGFLNLPTGCIVGKAVLKDVKKYASPEEFQTDKDRHLASIEFGSYGFVLESAQRLPEKKCKGNLNFWDAQEMD